MPPKKSQPTTQHLFDMQLRTSRAEKPGAPDMPKAKRSAAEVMAEKTSKEHEKAAKIAHRQAAIEKVAALENTMVAADAKANLIANHPPASNNAKVARKPVAVENKAVGNELKAGETGKAGGKKAKVIEAKQTTNKRVPPAATEAGEQTSGESSACERHDASDAVANQAVNKTNNDGGNAHQNQMKLDEKKKKGKQNKMGVRAEINTQRKALIPVAPVSAALLPERPTIAKRKAPVTGDNLVEIPSKKKKLQALAANRNASARSVSSESISVSSGSVGSLTATTGTDNDSVSTTTVPGTPGEDDVGLVLWGRPSLGAFGEGDVVQERQDVITKNGNLKAAVYRDRTAAKALSSVKITPSPMMGLAPRGSRASANQAKKDDIKLSALPKAMVDPFHTRFTPLIRDFAGTLEIWKNPTDADIWGFADAVFNLESQLDYDSELFIILSKLTSDRLSDWRTNFAKTAMTAVEKYFEDNGINDPAQRASTARWLLGTRYKFRPFYYRKCNRGDELHASGPFQSFLVSTVLATHYAAIASIHPDERSPGQPVGALGLSLQAVERALLCFTEDGIKRVPAGTLGHFSKTNWTDCTDAAASLINKSTNIVKLLDAVTDSQWEALVTTAEALVKAPKPKRFKELELIIPYSSDVEIIDCDDDNDKDDDNEEDEEAEAMNNEAFDSNEEAVDGEEEPVDEDVMEIDGVETDFGGEELEDDDIEA